MRKALENLRVLDLSRVLAGPVATQILGDLGAEIIKIERPGVGDDTRKWGPPYLKDKKDNDTDESAYYLSANRNKRSVAIDISMPEGAALVHALLEKCDVVIENFKTGGLARYGLGYEQVKKKYPHIIYCSITGFGQNGPLAGEPGYDFLAQAMSGLMAISGPTDGGPTKTGIAISDVMTGLYAVIGILAALRHRDKTGEGQHIDLALLDCTLAAMTNIAQFFLTSGALAPRVGNAHATIVPYRAFETADGYVIIAIGNDTQFRRFSEFAGKGWADDPRFATNDTRVRNRTALEPLIAEIIKAQPTDYWVKNLYDINVPVGPVNDMAQAFAHPQVKARAMEIEMNSEQVGCPVRLVGSPLKLSGTPVTYDRAPPTCGQHTEEVLKEILNLPDKEIRRLKNDKVLA